MYNIPTGSSDYPTPGSDTAGGGGGGGGGGGSSGGSGTNNNDPKTGKPSQFMVNITS